MLRKQHQPHTHNRQSGKQGGREQLLCQNGENQTLQILRATRAIVQAYGFLGPTSDLLTHHLQEEGLGDLIV